MQTKRREKQENTDKHLPQKERNRTGTGTKRSKNSRRRHRAQACHARRRQTQTPQHGQQRRQALRLAQTGTPLPATKRSAACQRANFSPPSGRPESGFRASVPPHWEAPFSSTTLFYSKISVFQSENRDQLLPRSEKKRFSRQQEIQNVSLTTATVRRSFQQSLFKTHLAIFTALTTTNLEINA